MMSGQNNRRSRSLFKSPLLWLLLVVLIGIFALGVWWSREPEDLSVEQMLGSKADLNNKPEEVLALATIAVMNTLLDKPGGYLSNDVLPPGVLLDDMPSWEFGALGQVRTLSASLREFDQDPATLQARHQSLVLAESRFNFNHSSWWLPDTEGEYREGIQYLRDYSKNVGGEGARSAEERDALYRLWLQHVDTQLRQLITKLNSVDESDVVELNFNIDPAAKKPKHDADIDNLFYEARGSAWALIQLLRASEIEFGQNPADKQKALVIAKMLATLENTQRTVYSPVILNGSGFGLLANHATTMSSYLVRVDDALNVLLGQLQDPALAPAIVPAPAVVSPQTQI